MNKAYFLIVLLFTVPFFSTGQLAARKAADGFRKYYPFADDKNKLPTTADILEIGGLSTTITEYKITSFVFSMRSSRADYIGPIQVSGADFNDDVKQKIRMYAGVSGTIYFEDIKAIGKDRRPRSLASVILKYKNN
ncbi:MAG: hypothetical protein JSS82_00695 [Bacteroidetes bacterium]|nr:hypothetical protein [Bacteroidota bacterium]